MKNIIEPWKKIENPRYRLRCIENLEKYLHKHGKDLTGYALAEKFKLKKELGA